MKKYLALLLWLLAVPAFAQDVANHAIPIGRGPGAIGFGIATLTDGQLLVGQTGADPLAKPLTGDCTLSAAGAITCSNTNKTTGARQAILSGSIDAGASSNFAQIGSGLNVNLVATATPLYLDFAAGFSVSGNIDFIGQEAADVTSFWSSLPASNYSFLSIDRNAGTGVLTATQTLVRPQTGPVFYAPRQALLHCDNNITDDWGNTWTSSGLTFSSGTKKFGTHSCQLSGTASFVKTTQILNPGQGNWTIDTQVNLTSNVSQVIFAIGNGTNFGTNVSTSASGKLVFNASSNGASNDIASTSTGATTVTSGTFHHVELTFDSSNYRVFLDGGLEITVSSSAIVIPDGAALVLGNLPDGSSPAAGFWDEFDFVPYARNTAAFSAPVAAYTISGDWLDTNQMVMKSATSAGPTFTAVQRLYVAEAQTGAATVSSVYSYQPTRQYNGQDFAYDSGTQKVKVGKSVFYGGTPQFLTAASSIGQISTFKFSTALVPPDAKYFWVQTPIFHAAIANAAGVGNQDCSINTRLPVGPIQNYGYLGTAFSNFTGMGAPTQATAFTEYAGQALRIPVINGIASFEWQISGTTCTVPSNNAFWYAILLGYDLP